MRANVFAALSFRGPAPRAELVCGLLEAGGLVRYDDDLQKAVISFLEINERFLQ